MQSSKQNKEENRKRRWMTIVFLPLIVILILLCLRACHHKLQPGIAIGGERIQEYHPNYDVPKHMIEVPGLQKEYIVDADNPELYLVNPKGNTVYFRYVICDAKDQILYQTDYIPPDRMEKADLYSILDEGVHPLLVKVETIDMENHGVCNLTLMKTHVHCK